MIKIPLDVIILTHNKEINIERLLKNVAGWADNIFVVDSYSSTDNTIENTIKIAKHHGYKTSE
jgi:hypothetical protein